jgi:hypothetical protein
MTWISLAKDGRLLDLRQRIAQSLRALILAKSDGRERPHLETRGVEGEGSGERVDISRESHGISFVRQGIIMFDVTTSVFLQSGLLITEGYFPQVAMA